MKQRMEAKTAINHKDRPPRDNHEKPRPCPWPSVKAPYTIHRVAMPSKLTKGGNWMEDRW